MTSVGMLGSSMYSRLVAMKEEGVPKEMSLVEMNNDREDEGFLGYKLCQRIHSGRTAQGKLGHSEQLFILVYFSYQILNTVRVLYLVRIYYEVLWNFPVFIFIILLILGCMT